MSAELPAVTSVPGLGRRPTAEAAVVGPLVAEAAGLYRQAIARLATPGSAGHRWAADHMTGAAMIDALGHHGVLPFHVHGCPYRRRVARAREVSGCER